MATKPHIWKHNDEMWTCEDDITWHVGWTPLEAYKLWAERKAAFTRLRREMRDREREKQMKKWRCLVCGLVYNEATGWPEDGIAPGTKWEDVPSDWECPDCFVTKQDFIMVEI